jgi:hypothetical protein
MIPDAAVLAMLAPGTILTIQVRAEDLLQAIQARNGGPEELSTAQAAQLIGRTSKWWRAQCEAGNVEGAYLDELKRWRLPNVAARAYHARLINAPQASTPESRSVRRGPRKKEAAK